MLTPEEEKRIKYLEKKRMEVINNDEPWYIQKGHEEDLERKIADIRMKGSLRDKHPNMGLPKGSLYYINYDNFDD